MLLCLYVSTKTNKIKRTCNDSAEEDVNLCVSVAVVFCEYSHWRFSRSVAVSLLFYLIFLILECRQEWLLAVCWICDIRFDCGCMSLKPAVFWQRTLFINNHRKSAKTIRADVLGFEFIQISEATGLFLQNKSPLQHVISCSFHTGRSEKKKKSCFLFLFSSEQKQSWPLTSQTASGPGWKL